MSDLTRVLHSKIIDWEYFSDGVCLQILIYLIAKVRKSPTTFKGHRIGTGELVVGRGVLALATGSTEQQIRTRVRWMKDRGDITWRKIETDERAYGVINLVKFSELQKSEEPKPLSEYMENQEELRKTNPSGPFLKWWTVYKKGARGGAWVEWQKATGKPPIEDLIEITKRYQEYCKSMERPLIDGERWIKRRFFDSVWTHEEQGTEPTDGGEHLSYE